MIGNVIVFIVIFLAAVYTGRRIYRTIMTKNAGCGCEAGCEAGKNCPSLSDSDVNGTVHCSNR